MAQAARDDNKIPTLLGVSSSDSITPVTIFADPTTHRLLVDVDVVSPLTTKGDIFTFDTADARLPVGANGEVLTADSAESLGVKWSSAGAGDMVLASVQTVTGAKTFNSGKMIYAGATSGTIILNAAAVAGSNTLTLPAATDTLVGKATTDTLTNKSIDLTNNTLTGTSAELATAISDETGSGALVFATSPTLVTPALGTPASGVLTNTTGYLGDSSLVTTGALNSGSITSGFGNIDNGTSTLDTGALTADSVDVGTGAATGVLQSNGNFDVTLQTGNATTGTITITDGANGDITLAPNGSGAVLLDGISVKNGNIGNGSDGFSTLQFANTTGNIISGAAGTEIFKLDQVTTAVNEFTVTNAATGNGPQLEATGGDTNIDIELIPKGTGIVKGELKRFMVRLVPSDTDNATGTTIEGDYRISNRAITVKAVGAYVDTAAATGSTLLTLDINEAGTTILSTKITIDVGEKTSETAATAPVISDTAIAADAIVTFDTDSVNETTASKGLTMWIDYIYA